MKLFERIFKARREANLTQEKLAEKIGVSLATFNRIEKGTVECSLEEVQKLAEAVGKPLSFFTETQQDGGWQKEENSLDSNFLCQYQHLLKILATMDKEKIEALITLLQ